MTREVCVTTMVLPLSTDAKVVVSNELEEDEGVVVTSTVDCGVVVEGAKDVDDGVTVVKDVLWKLLLRL